MHTHTPEPIPALAHGWTPERMALFLEHLSHKGNVRAACARVGLSREAAYRLRRRDARFARGWAAALVLARDAAIDVFADCAIDGVEHRVYFRGELVDKYRKHDARLLLAHVNRLEKLAAEEEAGKDVARFDELLAQIAGEELPDDLRGEDGEPLDREAAAEKAGQDALARVETPEDLDEDDPAACAALGAECDATYRAACLDGAAWFDEWIARACAKVDGLVAGGEAEARDFSPGTVSDVSTSALARGPAGRATGVAASTPQSSL